jgi:polyhydroxyalkanoate synthesis regulator phasin
MANLTLKREDRRISYEQGGYSASQNSPNEDEILRSFIGLEVDEARLTEQKEHLKTLLDQLEVKAKEKLEKRKRSVEKLNSEVSDLKRRCERFSKWLGPDSTSECSQGET